MLHPGQTRTVPSDGLGQQASKQGTGTGCTLPTDADKAQVYAIQYRLQKGLEMHKKVSIRSTGIPICCTTPMCIMRMPAAVP